MLKCVWTVLITLKTKTHRDTQQFYEVNIVRVDVRNFQ